MLSFDRLAGGKIGFISILLPTVTAQPSATSGGQGSPAIGWDTASRSGSDPLEEEATGHFLSTLSFCKITSKEYLSWIDFPSLHASKNLLNLREMEKKPALLHFNGQSCSNKPKCLMTSPVPHLPRGHNHPHTWRPEAFWAADSRQVVSHAVVFYLAAPGSTSTLAAASPGTAPSMASLAFGFS